MGQALGFVDKYKADEEMGPLPIFFAGDLNGSPRGEVSRQFRLVFIQKIR